MRCAHRNGLLMSAPELATELRDACGPTDQWRSGEDDEEDFGSIAGKRAGTEVYDASDDDDDEGSGELDIRPSGPLSIHSIAARAKSPTKPPARPPAKLPPPIPVRAKTEIEKFQGMELTSIINMIDVDQAGREAARRSQRGAAADARLGPAIARLGTALAEHATRLATTAASRSDAADADAPASAQRGAIASAAMPAGHEHAPSRARIPCAAAEPAASGALRHAAHRRGVRCGPGSSSSRSFSSPASSRSSSRCRGRMSLLESSVILGGSLGVGV